MTNITSLHCLSRPFFSLFFCSSLSLSLSLLKALKDSRRRQRNRDDSLQVINSSSNQQFSISPVVNCYHLNLRPRRNYFNSFMNACHQKNHHNELVSVVVTNNILIISNLITWSFWGGQRSPL